MSKELYGVSKIEIIPRFRALVVKDNEILGARGYNIYSYNISSKKLSKRYQVNDTKYAQLSKFKLLRRFFRAEITSLYTLNNGCDLVIAKKAIFKRERDSTIFTKCFNIPRGSRPLNLCITPDDSIYFGEYFSNPNKDQVHIYHSKDGGNNWEVIYTFNSGEINHIHGLFYDPYLEHIWVVTGDRDNECIIGYTADRFNSFNTVFRGGQEVRACQLLFYEDFITYATDSQYIQNSIKHINRDNFEITDLYSINGSGIYGGKSNNFAFFSSTIEPSKINTANESTVYLTIDGLKWKAINSFNKDIYHKSLFQFGSIQFPQYEVSSKFNFIVYSGRALKKIDGKTVIQHIK